MNDYREALKDDESLATFLKAMRSFDKRFCEMMTEGTDFTLRLEVHGNSGELLHVRVNSDGFERPKSGKVQEFRKHGKRLAG